VICHLTPCVNDLSEVFTALRKRFCASETVEIIKENIFSAITESAHMVKRASEFKSEGAGHGCKVANAMPSDLTPLLVTPLLQRYRTNISSDWNVLTLAKHPNDERRQQSRVSQGDPAVF
jgi:hypothetical protein